MTVVLFAAYELVSPLLVVVLNKWVGQYTRLGDMLEVLSELWAG